MHIFQFRTEIIVINGVNVISIEQCTNTHRQKYIHKKNTPGYNNACNLPPTDLAVLPHKTSRIKHKKKAILWSDNGDIMAAHIKINADVIGELLFYPAAVRTLSDHLWSDSPFITTFLTSLPPPQSPGLLANWEQEWHMRVTCQRGRGLTDQH